MEKENKVDIEFVRSQLETVFRKKNLNAKVYVGDSNRDETEFHIQTNLVHIKPLDFQNNFSYHTPELLIPTKLINKIFKDTKYSIILGTGDAQNSFIVRGNAHELANQITANFPLKSNKSSSHTDKVKPMAERLQPASVRNAESEARLAGV